MRLTLRPAWPAAACLLMLCGCGADAESTEPVTSTVGAAGGVITSADGRLSLDIPAGALDVDTMITITPISASQLDPEVAEVEVVAAYRLEPDGLAFAEDVLVAMEVDEGARAQGDPAAVFGTLSHSAAAGAELVGLGWDRPVDGKRREHAGVIRHFTDVLVGRMLTMKLELDCVAGCEPGEYGGKGRIQVQNRFASFSVDDAALSGRGAVELTATGAKLGDSETPGELLLTFSYACQEAGTGFLDIKLKLLRWQKHDGQQVTYGDGAVASAQVACVAAVGDACCFTEGCEIAGEAACDISGGVSMGEGSTCEPNPCQGACCDDGLCFNGLSSGECSEKAGAFLGPATQCLDGLCPAEVGACCIEDHCEMLAKGTCIERTHALSSAFQGIDRQCTEGLCAKPAGACCREGTCQVLAPAQCELLEGQYLGDHWLCSTPAVSAMCEQ